MNKKLMSIVMGLAVLTSVSTLAARRAAAQSAVAFENATIQPGGPRQGTFGEAFFNIEGEDNGDFASFGVARFDISTIKQQLESDFGQGGWEVDSVDLQLTQSNAGFTTDGAVEIYFTPDDESEIFPGGLLFYPFEGNFPDAQFITDYDFVELQDGEIETYRLYETSGINSGGGVALKEDILSDNIVTLALVDGDPAVAATYAGYLNENFEGPTLTINPAQIVTTPLQAGDADQDLQFDQFDLVQVQVANKYLSGQAATWGEGDWDGAPGGSPGSPPEGNGRFDQLDIVAAQSAGLYLTGPYGALAWDGVAVDAQSSAIPVPEPSTLGLVLLGLVSVFLRSRLWYG